MSGKLKSMAGKAARDYVDRKVDEAKAKAAKSAAQRVFLEKKPHTTDIEDRIDSLRDRYTKLEGLFCQLDTRIRQLEEVRRSTSFFRFGAKSEIDDDIRSTLWLEYIIYDYLTLLLSLAKKPRKMNREERRFYNTCGKYLDELMRGSTLKALVARSIFTNNSLDYVSKKHSRSIARRERCDMRKVLAELQAW